MLDEIKSVFHDYHQNRGFNMFDSFPLVIDDPTILFTNATIAPFKAMFMGTENRENFALVQRCLRLGGSGGNLETPRINLQYTSMFDMLGGGMFDVSQDSVVSYFIEVLATLDIRKENLLFTTLPNGFDQALMKAGINPCKIHVFSDSRDIRHEWSFGEGDLHGCGVMAWYTPGDCNELTSENVLQQISRSTLIGRVVHIDGIVQGSEVKTLPYSAYDIGIGLSRVEIARNGNCDISMRPWRLLSSQFQSAISELSETDAHYMANLYRIAEALIHEGLLPGKKKQASALRKVVRLLIEEIWIQSDALVDIPAMLDESISISLCPDLLISVLLQEERSLQVMISTALKKQKKHPEMSEADLRSTFGIRPGLLKL